MAEPVVRLSGDDWQRLANQILAEHYGPMEYQRVPDEHKGDSGIEGFTVSTGHAYQAYGCEEPVTPKERTRRQQRKMTADINKFIRNSSALSKIFGATSINRWALFVPTFSSAAMVEHASKKTKEVIDASLAYAARDFHVMVVDELSFAAARDRVLNNASGLLTIPSELPDQQDLDLFQEQETELLRDLDAKLRHLVDDRDSTALLTLRTTTLRAYLKGQGILEALRRYPSVFERVVRAKGDLENRLAILTASAGDSPGTALREALSDLRRILSTEAKQLQQSTSEDLVYEAVADWLIRCPLHFAKVASNE